MIEDLECLITLWVLVMIMSCSVPQQPKTLKAPPLKAAAAAAATAPTVTLVPDTAMTYTDGTYTWAGNPFCVGLGYNYTLQPSSPARGLAWKNCTHTDTFTLQCNTGPDDTPPNSVITFEDYFCPAKGSALNQPRLPDAAGSYCLEWWDDLGPSAGACQYVENLIPPTPLVCDIGTDAFRGCYYRDMSFGSLALVRDDPKIDFDWVDGSPDPSLPADLFSVKWEGDFDFSGGTYEFTATVDDGIRVYVDGSNVIDSWQDQAATTYTGTIALTAGMHRIRVEYYENGGEAVAKVSWVLSSSTTVPNAPSSITVH